MHSRTTTCRLPANGNLVRSRILVSEHPLVRVHPESGERALFVSPSFLKSIVGLAARESGGAEFLWEHIVRPEFTLRFRCEPGSVAFWDNRATAHLAPRDIFDSDFDRQFYRVTLLGDVPAGVDAKPSRALQGDRGAGIPVRPKSVTRLSTDSLAGSSAMPSKAAVFGGGPSGLPSATGLPISSAPAA